MRIKLNKETLLNRCPSCSYLNFEKEYAVDNLFKNSTLIVEISDNEGAPFLTIIYEDEYTVVSMLNKPKCNPLLSKEALIIKGEENITELETRPCGDCLSFRKNTRNETSCCKYSLDVNKDDQVCYLVKEGSCFRGSFTGAKKQKREVITHTLYAGNSSMEAEITYDFLENMRKRKETRVINRFNKPTVEIEIRKVVKTEINMGFYDEYKVEIIGVKL